MLKPCFSSVEKAPPLWLDRAVGKLLDFTTHFTFQGTGYTVRPAREGDIETLREWKNDASAYFHLKTPITPEQQKQWFAAFQTKRGQQMFVAEGPHGLTACVGFRTLPDTPESTATVELFNLICGDSRLQGTGFAREFYGTVTGELRKRGVAEICLEVLKTNERGNRWYLKQGYVKTGEKPGCNLLTHRIRSGA